jgi:hypothetical protein
MLFSSEHCSSRLQTDESVYKLKSLLDSQFSEVKIVFYLRLQNEMALSTYSTGVRNGEVRPFDIERVTARSRVLNYDTLLKRWEGVFGIENIAVRIFNRSLFKGGSLINDFLDTIGVNIDISEQERLDVKNQSYDVRTLEFLRLINQYLPKFHKDGKLNINRGNIGQIVENISNFDDKPKISFEDKLTILDRFQDSNSEVFQRYGLYEEFISITDINEQKNTENNIDVELSNSELVHLFAKVWASRERDIQKVLQELKS